MKPYLLILFLPMIGFSQVGPGGVNTNLEYWFRADVGTSTIVNGASVTTWTDQSGNGNNATAAGAARPTYVASNPLINGRPCLDFNGSQQLNMTYVGNSNENMSYGVVVICNTPNNQLDIIHQHGGRNTLGYRGSSLSNPDRFTDFIGGSDHNAPAVNPESNWYIHQKTAANTGPNRLRFYIDETPNGVFTHNIENRTSTTHIGGNGPGGGTALNGQIAEIYKIGHTMNDAERTIIANYFSAKYNRPIPVASDFYQGDTPANGDFDYEVIGVGNETTGIITGNHTLSQNSGGLTISSIAGYGDGDYLFAGHDNTPITVNQVDIASNIPCLQGRWDRVWYFDVTDAGAGNQSTITFDFSDAGIGAVPGITTNYYLLYRPGTSGPWTNAGLATSVAGDQINFDANSLPNGDGYYTLGTCDLAISPLPIELSYFDAQLNEIEHVDLSWETVSELNNDYFTIERSRDGEFWTTLTIIEGAGTSTEVKNYSTVDTSPYSGVSYYRLKQTDFDGEYSYSDVRAISRSHSIELTVFPNPATTHVTISGTESDVNSLVIYNLFGQSIQLPVLESTSTTRITFDVSTLTKGTYLIRTANTQRKLVIR